MIKYSLTKLNVEVYNQLKLFELCNPLLIDKGSPLARGEGEGLRNICAAHVGRTAEAEKSQLLQTTIKIRTLTQSFNLSINNINIFCLRIGRESRHTHHFTGYGNNKLRSLIDNQIIDFQPEIAGYAIMCGICRE